MKILVIPYLPSAVRATPIAKTLSETGHDVHMITWSMPYPLSLPGIVESFGHSWKEYEYKDEQVTMHKVRRIPLFFPPINRRWFKRQVRSIFERCQLDFIFSETYFSETEPPLDLPLFYDLSDDHEAFPEIYGSPAYKFAFRLLAVHSTIVHQIQASKAVFAVSDELVAYAKEYRDDDAIFKLTNGVEDWVLSLPYSPGKKHSLVYVTNYGKWSQVVPLIKVVGELEASIPDISLTLVGDGPEIPAAEQYVEDNELEHLVTFTGRIRDRRQLMDQVNLHELCLNISEKNRFRDAASPMKVFEYSALAKKVVSSELNGVKELGFDNIYFFDNELWAESLKKAIQEAFGSEVDATAVRKQVAKYVWTALLGGAEEVFESRMKPSGATR